MLPAPIPHARHRPPGRLDLRRPGPGRLAGRRASLLLILAAAVLLAGCGSVGYYAQSVHGHLSLLAAREPIPELLAGGAELDADTRGRLERVLEIRRFASAALDLPDNGSYRSYVALDRDFVVWSVMAAPRFSVEPRTWCFPVAGCVAYRGYYREAAARAYGRTLAAQGDDVYVGGVPAYSTLGWLDDPLPSSVLHWPEWRLAGLIFHELAHQVAYVPGDTAFNEAFATAVEAEGVRRWLAARGSPGQRAAHERFRREQAAVLDLYSAARTELAALYARGLPEAEMARRKAARIASLRTDLEAVTGRSEEWAGINNARIASVATYHRLVPAFAALLAEGGGDLPRFYRAVATLAELPAQTRRARLQGYALALDRARPAREDGPQAGANAGSPSGPRGG